MRHRFRALVTLLALLVAMTGTFLLTPLAANAASQSGTTTRQSRPHLHTSGPSANRNSQISPLRGIYPDLVYHTGPVMAGTANVYAIFWEPTNNVDANYNSLIKRYFGDVGSNSLYQIANQYTQSSSFGGGAPSNAVLAGSWVDTHAFPESPLMDSDIQAEVTHAQQVNGWSSSIDNIFFVYPEKGISVCTGTTSCSPNAFCAYHGFFGTNTIYAAMPYVAAGAPCSLSFNPNSDDADFVINFSSHEEMEAATDPLLNAWFDSNGAEIGDKCESTFGPLNAQNADVVWNTHPYIVQEEWDNSSSFCQLAPTIVPGATCVAAYTIITQYPGGFEASIQITNLGTTAINGWTLTFSFPNGQVIPVGGGWNGNFTQVGSNVTITNASYNATIPAGGDLDGNPPSFNASWNNSLNAPPHPFTLNGSTCSG